MERSQTLYEGLLEDQQLAAATSSKRRWKIAAAISGVAVVAMGAIATSLAKERFALQAQLSQQQARVTATPAAAARTGLMRTSAIAVGDVLATDTCTVAGKDIYGEPPTPDLHSPGVLFDAHAKSC